MDKRLEKIIGESKSEYTSLVKDAKKYSLLIPKSKYESIMKMAIDLEKGSNYLGVLYFVSTQLGIEYQKYQLKKKINEKEKV